MTLKLWDYTERLAWIESENKCATLEDAFVCDDSNGTNRVDFQRSGTAVEQGTAIGAFHQLRVVDEEYAVGRQWVPGVQTQQRNAGHTCEKTFQTNTHRESLVKLFPWNWQSNREYCTLKTIVSTWCNMLRWSGYYYYAPFVNRSEAKNRRRGWSSLVVTHPSIYHHMLFVHVCGGMCSFVRHLLSRPSWKRCFHRCYRHDITRRS